MAARCPITGGSFFRNDASRVGGGLETLGGRVNLTNISFEGNRANGDREDLANRPGSGGALHISSAGQILAVGIAIAGNQATSEGGGAWCSSAGTLILERAIFSGNVANFGVNSDQQNARPAGGGGVYNAGGTLGVRDTVFDENQALNGGGALYNSGKASVENTRFTNNVVSGETGDGGAIFSVGPLTLSGCTLRGNRAARAGGAIENAGNATILNCTLSGNTATFDGGALHNGGAGRVFFIGSSALGNDARGNGGALWNGGVLAVRNSTIDGNTAALGDSGNRGGGGIYNAGGTLTLDSATITSNKSGNGGGGIFDAGGNVSSRNSIIALNTIGGVIGGADLIGGAFSSQGYNLIGIAPFQFVARTGDLTGTKANPLDPQLNDFGSGTGPTPARVPQSGSPVIDAGSTSAQTDQRGIARPQGARADIGAVEVAGAQSSTNAAVSAPSRPSGGAS